MRSCFGALCDDFYVSSRLHLRLDLAVDRETVLHFFERVRRAYPAMHKLRRTKEGSLCLEEESREGDSYRWLRLEPSCIRFGYFAPRDPAEYREFSRFLLEQAPYHLTLSDLDVDHMELVYAFAMEYRGNHDQLVAETLFADHPLSSFLIGEEAVHAIDCQPYLGIALNPACDLQAYVEVKSRTSTYEVRTGEYDQQMLSVFLVVRKYWDPSEAADLVRTHELLSTHADRLAVDKVVPILVNPLAHAIASRPG